MKGRKHTPEQIVRKLREADRLLAEGKGIAEVAKALEITEHTFSRWRNQYGGTKADDAKELRRLRDENGRLKRMVADQALDIEMLKKGPGKLLSQSRRQDAVRKLREQFGVLQRRACRVTGQHRATQRRPGRVVPAPEDQPRARLRELSRLHPRHGYRMIWGHLRNEGWKVNRKRVQRLWRDEGLRVPPCQPKRSRIGISTVPVARLCAEFPRQVSVGVSSTRPNGN